jgi:pimeloyl-ACP methyl ester carboxylesterase
LLHLYAALQRPDLYQGVVMLDSPALTLADQWVIRAAKRFGFIDRLTPAGRTLGRRAAFPDREAARAYFSRKPLFRDFDPDCFDAYLEHGLYADEQGLRLRFDPGTEIDIYRSVPHARPASTRRLRVPLALVHGADSRVVLAHHARSVQRLRQGETHQVKGGHMFPLEHPSATAQLLKGILVRWQGARA